MRGSRFRQSATKDNVVSWLNDHPAGVGTFCAEIDTIQCDEDMV